MAFSSAVGNKVELITFVCETVDKHRVWNALKRLAKALDFFSDEQIDVYAKEKPL